MPNLVVAFEIIINHSIINDVETFVDALKPFIFEGVDCIQNYCEWVMSEDDNLVQRKVNKTCKKLSV